MNKGTSCLATREGFYSQKVGQLQLSYSNVNCSPQECEAEYKHGDSTQMFVCPEGINSNGQQFNFTVSDSALTLVPVVGPGAGCLYNYKRAQ